jgi:septum formation inhibitor MinC
VKHLRIQWPNGQIEDHHTDAGDLEAFINERWGEKAAYEVFVERGGKLLPLEKTAEEIEAEEFKEFQAKLAAKEKADEEAAQKAFEEAPKEAQTITSEEVGDATEILK